MVLWGGVAAVIDWKTKSIVAVAHDRRRTAPASHRHCFSCTGSLSESDATPAFLPIWHAVPTVCDLVAKRQLLQYYQHMHDARDLHSLGVKRASEGCPSEPNTEIPYLLTDCDVVLTHEVHFLFRNFLPNFFSTLQTNCSF
jgi:hypothetical protein